MTHVIIFSKNRAMQLDALLRSMDKHGLPYDRVSVLFKASSKNYEGAYNILTKQHPKKWFIPDIDFCSQTKELLRIPEYDKICFLVDDDLFYRDVVLTEVECDVISYRLGNNIADPKHFEYPMSVDGHVFDREPISLLVENMKFNNPNDLEKQLQGKHGHEFKNIWHPPASCLVGIPVNRVSDGSHCRFGEKHHHDEFELNKLFLEGKRIDIDNLEIGKVEDVHKEIELRFIDFL